MFVEPIKVTIYCMTYNHVAYIRDTLNGFVSQKTNFSFEVIIHDDASTDGTTEIIKEFEMKYPDIIKPIYQSENQWGKGSIVRRFILNELKGKYTAICEGDDYWIDSYKLQKQYDYMENNVGCTFCFTNAIIENQITNEKRKFIPYSDKDAIYYKFGDRDYTLSDFYQLSFVPTASFFMLTSAFIKSFSMYEKRCPVGDLKYRLYVTSQGYAHFIDECTCVYRECVPNSAMTSWSKNNYLQKHNRALQIIDMLSVLDSITNYQYHVGLLPFIQAHSDALFVENNFFDLFKNQYLLDIYKTSNVKKQIKYILKLLLPKSVFLFILGERK